MRLNEHKKYNNKIVVGGNILQTDNINNIKKARYFNMAKFEITSSEFEDMLLKLNSDDPDVLLIYAPEYHKLVEISYYCHDIYGEEVNLIDTPFETVTALNQVPNEFIKLPEKKNGVETEVLLREWLVENDIEIIENSTAQEDAFDAVSFRDPVSKIVKFISMYFKQLSIHFR